jgi:hypothetical protein
MKARIGLAMAAVATTGTLGLGCGGGDPEAAAGAYGSAVALLAADAFVLNVDTTEDAAAVHDGIAIAASAAHAIERVAYSLPLSGVGAGERLDLTGIVAMSRCGKHDFRKGGNQQFTGNKPQGGGVGNLRSPCEKLKGNPYAYAPHVEAHLVLAAAPGDAHGAHLTAWEGYRCTKALHHCPIEMKTSLDAAALVLGPGDLRYVNLVVRAWHPDARAHDVVELEADCEKDDYGACQALPLDPADAQTSAYDTRGQLSVLRLGPNAQSDARSEHALVNATIPVQTSGNHNDPAATPVIVQRMRVAHLRPGDVVEATGRFTAKNDAAHNGSFVFTHFLGSWLALTDDPDDLRPSHGAPRWLSPTSGRNCDPQHGCRVARSGAVTVPEGAPEVMWVTYAATAVEEASSAVHKRAKVLASPAPVLTVTCHSAPRAPGDLPCHVP